jgi:hypothetical protein
MSDEIETTSPQHYTDKPNIAQNIKGETDPHAHEQNVKLEELHPQLDQVQKVIDALRYYRRVVRNPYKDPGFNLALAHARHFESVLLEGYAAGTATLDEQQYLIELQNILHYHIREVTFQQELTTLINKYTQSETDDHLLAGYLIKCMYTWNEACRIQRQLNEEKQFFNPTLGEPHGSE